MVSLDGIKVANGSRAIHMVNSMRIEASPSQTRLLNIATKMNANGAIKTSRIAARIVRLRFTRAIFLATSTITGPGESVDERSEHAVNSAPVHRIVMWRVDGTTVSSRKRVDDIASKIHRIVGPYRAPQLVAQRGAKPVPPKRSISISEQIEKQSRLQAPVQLPRLPSDCERTDRAPSEPGCSFDQAEVECQHHLEP